MKKYIIKILLFILVIFIIDLAFGKVGAFLVANAKGGDIKRDNLINDSIKDDIIILGSSRAYFHYNPRIITDSLHESCYNCGQQGNGIIMLYGRYKMLSSRYNPKLIVYDVEPEYDLLDTGDNHSFLTELKEYYDKPGVYSIFNLVDNNEKYKMLSNMFKYNTRFLSLISYYRHEANSTIKGYEPLHGIMNYEPKPEHFENAKIDTLKLSLLKDLIMETRGKSKLMFIISPMYKSKYDKSIYTPLMNLCNKYHVVFIDDSNVKSISDNRRLFNDSYHLNKEGSDKYSKYVVSSISKALR